MIHSIRLKNFESHKNSVFEFSPYINVISGQSNHGKSSVIRSIYWIKDNKPSGSSMVSFWNRDKKGNPKQRTFAEIVSGEDEVAIRRERSPDLNGYEINDSSRLEAVGQGSPEEVVKLLNLSDVNIQYQFDRPFLLDESPAEVARIFNRVVHLDSIDRIQSKAELLRKQANSEINLAKGMLDDYSKQVNDLSWIEEAEELVNKISALDQVYDVASEKADKLANLLEELHSYMKTMARWKKLEKAKALCSSIDELDKTWNAENRRFETIRSLIEDKSHFEEIIRKFELISPARDIIVLIEEKQKDKELMNNRWVAITELLVNRDNCIRAISTADENALKYQKMLPDVCPLCGSKL